MILVILGAILYDHYRKKPDYTQADPREENVRQKIAQQIEQVATSEVDPKIKLGIQRALAIVKSGAVAQAVNMENQSPSGVNSPAFAPTSASSVATVTTSSASTTVVPAKAPTSNAITLLYVGAFLFVTAMIIFIAAPVLSGGVKTLLVLFTATLFYGLGLWLHQASKIFRPAGQTFVAIGMVILPLVGIAAYNLVFEEQHAYAIWLVTSVASFGAYVYALQKFRTTLMGYLSILSALSLAESAVLTTGLPLYFVSWTLSLIAIALAIISKYKKLWVEQKEPLQFSAHLLLPTSLVIAAVNIPKFGWWQFSAALVLSAMFYVYCAQDKDKTITDRSTFYAIAMLMLLGVVPSVSTALRASMQASLIALLTATSVVATSLTVLTRAGQHPLYRQSLEILGFVPFISIWFLLGNEVILIALTLSLVILVSVAYALRSAIWLCAAFVPLLAMPLAASSTIDGGLSALTLSIIYSSIGVSALAVRYIVANRAKDLQQSVSILYVAALVMGWVFAVNHGIQFGALILAVDMVLVAIASFIEREPNMFGVAYGGLFVAVTMALSTNDTNFGLYLSIAYAVLSLSAFGIAQLSPGSLRAQLIQRIAPFGMYAASLSAFFTATASSNVPPALLIVAAAMLWFQSRKRAEVELESAAYISISAAVSWVLINLGIKELLVFTHLWAVTFALMYMWRNDANDKANADNFLLLSLVSLSVPFGLQTLGNSGTARGWLFVIEHLGLMLLGMTIKNDKVMKWGLVVAVGGVIFQLRDLTFLLLGALGLTVIGIAIWLLNREGKKPGNK